jgi:hypothetical protein
MDKWVKGDEAVSKLETRFRAITKSNMSFNEKFVLIDDAFHKAIEPWNLKGDDRVLSKMRIAALSAVEDSIEDELARMNAGTKLSAMKKQDTLDIIRKRVQAAAWLPDAVKSSIACSLSFARYDATLEKDPGSSD